MKSQNTKSSDQLKREVDQQIRKVEGDLRSMEGRLSPGQLIDDAIFYPRGRNLSATVDHLKRNPVGTAFLSLGTILLMEDNEHNTMEYNARAKLNTVKDSMTSVKSAIKDQLPHKELTPGMAPSRGDIARDKVHQFKDQVQSKVHDLKEKIPSKDAIRTKVQDMKEGVTSRFSHDEVSEESNFSFDTESKTHLKDKARDMYSSAKDRASTVFSENKDRVKNLDPMTYMALGAGLGALTGAALPVSEKESSLIQGKFDDKLSGLGTDLQNAINECSNILKDLVIQDVKDYNVSLFK